MSAGTAFHPNEKQNEAGDGQKLRSWPAQPTTASQVFTRCLAVAVMMDPPPARPRLPNQLANPQPSTPKKRSSPVGPKNRQIAVIGTDHRPPNEPLWPIRSPFWVVWSHGRRATSQWVNHHTVHGGDGRQFFYHEGQTNCRMDILSSSRPWFSILPPSCHIANTIKR